MPLVARFQSLNRFAGDEIVEQLEEGVSLRRLFEDALQPIGRRREPRRIESAARIEQAERLAGMFDFRAQAHGLIPVAGGVVVPVTGGGALIGSPARRASPPSTAVRPSGARL